MFLVVLFLFFGGLLMFYKLIKPHHYWRDKGVPYIKPWPILGNMGKFTLRISSLTDNLSELYNANLDRRYDGMFQFMHPTLLIRDPELIKRLTVKEFDSFSDVSSTFISQQNDNLVKKALLFLKRESGWQDMRSILSPAFTSSKMKMIFVLMEECSDQLSNYFLEQPEDVVTVDTMNTFTRVTNDVIASAAFGIHCDSLKNPNNEFYLQGKKTTDRSGLKSLILIVSFLPKIIEKLLRVRLISADSEDFFLKLIRESIKHREQNNIIRYDMLHLLIEAQKSRLNSDAKDDTIDEGFAVVKESELTTNKRVKASLSIEDITAQAILFFIAGFDTSAVALSHLSYELALHPDIQGKLQREIDEAMQRCNKRITYEELLRMKYLDCVVSESLRLRSVGIVINREATKPFTIEPELPGEISVHLEKSSTIWIPVWPLHHNPEHFPNPDKFDPERFSDENKHNIKPHTYMPFGSGPRNCIGSRFALLLIKIVILKLLRNFNIVVVDKTEIPFTPAKASMSLLPKNGLWVGFKKRPIPNL